MRIENTAHALGLTLALAISGKTYASSDTCDGTDGYNDGVDENGIANAPELVKLSLMGEDILGVLEPIQITTGEKTLLESDSIDEDDCTDSLTTEWVLSYESDDELPPYSFPDFLFIPNEVGTYYLTVTVTDPAGLSTSESHVLIADYWGGDTDSVDSGFVDTGSVDTGSVDTGSVDSGFTDTANIFESDDEKEPEGCNCSSVPYSSGWFAIGIASLFAARRRRK